MSFLKNRGEFITFCQLEMLIASALLLHSRAVPFLLHLLLISLTMPLISQALSDSVMLCSQFCSLLHSYFDQRSSRFLSISKCLPFLGHTVCKSRSWKWNNTNIPIFQNSRLRYTSFWANISVLWKKLSAVALDAPSIIPREYPLSASLCVQVTVKEQKQFALSRKKHICRRLTSDSSPQQGRCTCLHENVLILLSRSLLLSPRPLVSPTCCTLSEMWHRSIPFPVCLCSI